MSVYHTYVSFGASPLLCAGNQIILENNEDDLKQNVEKLYKVLQT
jgi:hypothetical protein